MPLITFAGRIYNASTQTPLLETLLSEKALIPYSCRSGYCHSCLMKANKGKPPVKSQECLDQAKRAQGYFLACQCMPEEDMNISLAKRNKIAAVITGKERLTPTITALEITPIHTVDYSPGQSVTLWATDTLTRPCYLASISKPNSPLTVHIPRRIGCEFSQWAHDCTQVGQKISISDVHGLNIYQTLSSNTLILVQDGCLAPVLSLLHQLDSVSDQDISMQLILQVDQQDNLYCMAFINAFEKKHKKVNLKIHCGADNPLKLKQTLNDSASCNQAIIAGYDDFIKQYSRHLQMDIFPLLHS